MTYNECMDRAQFYLRKHGIEVLCIDCIPRYVDRDEQISDQEALKLIQELYNSTLFWEYDPKKGIQWP